MPGRPGPLTLAGYTLALLLLLGMNGGARAHRLEADYRVLPDRKVLIGSWFDRTGDPPRKARVQVFRPQGQLLAEGPLDEKGQFTFPFDRPEELRVVVAAGEGHRKELTIPAADLATASASEATLSDEGTSAARDNSPSASPFDRSSRVSVKDILVGVGFLLALAAFVLSLRNARQLREFKTDSQLNGKRRTNAGKA
jgi:nickel transport protein